MFMNHKKLFLHSFNNNIHQRDWGRISLWLPKCRDGTILSTSAVAPERQQTQYHHSQGNNQIYLAILSTSLPLCLCFKTWQPTTVPLMNLCYMVYGVIWDVWASHDVGVLALVHLDEAELLFLADKSETDADKGGESTRQLNCRRPGKIWEKYESSAGPGLQATDCISRAKPEITFSAKDIILFFCSPMLSRLNPQYR